MLLQTTEVFSIIIWIHDSVILVLALSLVNTSLRPTLLMLALCCFRWFCIIRTYAFNRAIPIEELLVPLHDALYSVDLLEPCIVFSESW